MSDIVTLERMIALARKGAGGLDSDDISDDEVVEQLNFSLWEMSEKFPWKEKECLITTPTVEGVEIYGLPIFLDAIRAVAIQDEDGKYRIMKRMTPEIYQNIGDDGTDETLRGIPTMWMRRHSNLIIWPRPDSADYTIRIEIWRVIPTLEDGTVDLADVPRNWQEIIIDGAVTRILTLRQDYNLARQRESFRMERVRNAVLDVVKEDKATHYGGLQVLDEWPVRGDE